MSESADLQALEHKLAVLPSFRWMPGTLLLPAVPGLRGGGSQIRLCTEEDCIEAERLNWPPDLSDPATLGCLAALVREAWGDTTIMVIRRRDDGWRVLRPYGSEGFVAVVPGTFPSRAHAWVAALEAAPER